MPKSSNPGDFGIFEAPEWRLYESHIRPKLPAGTDVMVKVPLLVRFYRFVTINLLGIVALRTSVEGLLFVSTNTVPPYFPHPGSLFGFLLTVLTRCWPPDAE
jgi:hypothetical protein